MTETTKGNGIADSPFKFIETPAHAQNAKVKLTVLIAAYKS